MEKVIQTLERNMQKMNFAVICFKISNERVINFIVYLLLPGEHAGSLCKI